LQRNGIGPDGVPLVQDPAWRTADPGLRRKLLRASARRMYRFGVRTFEPRIRKWAQL
jgi:hypothetical protein